MSFFDDKQEILKVELTTYGRYLISKGKFKPTYYAFFDDDILYDANHANLNEKQNLIQTRILEESLSIKPQTTFTGVEKNVKNINLVSSEASSLKKEEEQIKSDKNYALSLPLGNSLLSSDYLPSWSLRFTNGSIETVNNYIDNSNGEMDSLQPFLKIPQINLKDIEFDIKRTVNIPYNEEGYSVIAATNSEEGQIFYSLKEVALIVDIKENNVDDLMKNFDVEIFIEEEELLAGRNEKKKILKKLYFTKEKQYIVDNILLDMPLEYKNDIDETYSEYYFEITVDDEIDVPPQQQEKFVRRSTSSAQGALGADC
jgi:hypothetical protein